MEAIQKEIQVFLEKMTFPSSVSMAYDEEGGMRVSIETPDARLLIGSGGEMIGHIDALVKKIIQKKIPDTPRFYIDINDYRIRHFDALKEEVKRFAKEVRLYRKEKVLDPMPSIERRVIHSTLSEYPDISTESIGVDPDRRIVIKPFNDGERAR